MYDINIDYNTIELYKAVKYKTYDILDVLLKKQRYKNTINDFLILKYTILQDDYISLIKFIDKGFDINIIDSFGYTLLRYAVENNCIRVSKLLLENGFRISTNDYILLFTAIHNRNIEIIDLLIIHGINVDAVDLKGYNALYYAVRSNDNAIVSFLLIKGASIETVNKYSLLHYLVTSRNTMNTLTTLLEYGADTDLIDNFKAPIHTAVEYNNNEAVLKFINKNVDINVADSLIGLTPLHYAIKQHNYEVSVILIKNGADVNKKDNNENTPLFSAVKINDIKFTKLLLDNGAILNVSNILGETPVEVAINNNCFNIVEFIMEYFKNSNDI
ncbi:SWPV1-043 [Shearwaterpox virus]|uniref:SWPV1-043 n=1 Tax=Shearwaterpox virus TaxID=1974596 RepID=A0A1V0S7Q6_CNPV|nr:SWPV1-043 [Shearwaterpox virus]